MVPAWFWNTDQLCDAFANQHIGQVARAYRKHAFHIAAYGHDGITQEMLGGWLGVTQPQISRIENGPPIRNLDSLCYWARRLRMPPEMLWFRLPPEQCPRSEMSAEVGGAADDHDAQPYEGLTHALQHPTSVDLIVVARLREQIHDLAARYDRLPSSSLLVEAGQCSGQVALLRARAGRSDVRHELYAIEAECATFIGQLLWDASQRRNHAAPRACFDQAIWAARQICHRAAEGLALLRKSFIALYSEKDPKAGLSLARQTADTTRRESHVLTGIAMLHVAEAQAMLSQRRACEQALNEAGRHFDKIETTDVAMGMFSPTQPDRLAGSCHLFLGNAKRAESILKAVAPALGDRSKSRAIVLGNLALSQIRQSKLDEAATTLHEAIEVVELTRGGGGLNILFGAGRELLRQRPLSAVQDVHDRLFNLMTSA